MSDDQGGVQGVPVDDPRAGLRSLGVAMGRMQLTMSEFSAQMRETGAGLAGAWLRLGVQLSRFMEELEAAGLDPQELAAMGEPEQVCHCLCSMHREAGMFCAGAAVSVLTLRGGLVDPREVEVAMCGPCAGWWREHRPGRVVEPGIPALAGGGMPAGMAELLEASVEESGLPERTAYALAAAGQLAEVPWYRVTVDQDGVFVAVPRPEASPVEVAAVAGDCWRRFVLGSGLRDGRDPFADVRRRPWQGRWPDDLASQPRELVCPKCLKVSPSIDDVDERYCGNCHDDVGVLEALTERRRLVRLAASAHTPGEDLRWNVPVGTDNADETGTGGDRG